MKRIPARTALATGLALFAQSAVAEGALNLYNFGLYTPPELLEKFSSAPNSSFTWSSAVLMSLAKNRFIFKL